MKFLSKIIAKIKLGGKWSHDLYAISHKFEKTEKKIVETK